MKNYKMGTYKFPTKTKRVYSRKRNYNKTYKSRPTKRRIKGSLIQGKSIFKVVLAIISIIIVYNIAHINGAVVSSDEATTFVDPFLAGRAADHPSPAGTAKTVEQQIRAKDKKLTKQNEN